MRTEVIKSLFELKCVQVSVNPPFSYASGLKGPIYCDNRKLVSHPTHRKTVITEFANLVKAKNLKFDFIAGLATAGIPHGAWLAHELDVPFCYVRSKPKAHGKGNQVEGDVPQGSKLLFVEDLVNQGSSLREAVDGVKREGLEVVDCLSIVNYETPAAKEVLSEIAVELHALVSFSDICQYAEESSLLNSSELQSVKQWHSDPKNWSV